jgi:hypothetical protein
MPPKAKQASKGGGMFRVAGRGDARLREFSKDAEGNIVRGPVRRLTAEDGWFDHDKPLDEMYPNKFERASGPMASDDPAEIQAEIDKLQQRLAAVQAPENLVPSAEQQVAALPENAAAGNRDTRFPPGEGPNAPEGDGGSEPTRAAATSKGHARGKAAASRKAARKGK